MRQNASRDSWSFEYTQRRPAEIMTGIHDRCAPRADDRCAPGDQVLGASIAGFLGVADAMRAQGII